MFSAKSVGSDGDRKVDGDGDKGGNRDGFRGRDGGLG